MIRAQRAAYPIPMAAAASGSRLEGVIPGIVLISSTNGSSSLVRSRSTRE